MIYNLYKKIQGWTSPQVRPPLCPNNKCETQTLWPQPDTKQIKFCYGALTSLSPSSPHQQNQFWKDWTRCFVRNGQSGKWIDANLLMCLFVFVAVSVCVCVSLFLSLQRRVWTGCGERLPSAPWYLPRWDANIYLFSAIYISNKGRERKRTYWLLSDLDGRATAGTSDCGSNEL